MSRRSNLILLIEMQHGYRDARTMDCFGPSLFVRVTNYRLALKVTDLPVWSFSHRGLPDFLQGFSKAFNDALLYLLEDAPEITPGQHAPECTYKHLSQLADFLKETN